MITGDRISGVNGRLQRPLTPHQHETDWSGHAMAVLYSKRGKKPRPLADRFWAFVVKSDDGCWLWTGPVAGRGYGMITLEGGRSAKRAYAHRLSWEWANGRAVPRGLMVLHSCDVPACVRPDHLRIGTAKDNADDARERGRLASTDLTRHPGESNGRAKITAEQALEIRNLYRAAPRKVRIRRGTLSQIASTYGITTTMVLLIAKRKNWRET